MSKILIDEATVRQVLEALEELTTSLRTMDDIERGERAITALKALAKDVPETNFGNMAEQPAQQCKWPTCQSEEYQQVLAEQIKRELVGEQPAQQEFVLPGGGYVPAIPAQQALDKMAENARELGLDYEPAQQEPVAKVNDDGFIVETGLLLSPGTPLYTSPPAQRTWVGLTDEEIKKLAAPLFMTHYWKLCNEFARAIEAKLRSKNEDRN